MSKKGNFSVIKYLLKLSFKERKRIYFLYFLQFITLLLQTFQWVLLPKYLIDELVHLYENEPSKEQLFKIIMLVVLTLACRFLSDFFNNFVMHSKNCVGEWFNEYFEVKILNKSASLDFENTEDPEIMNKMNKARDGIGSYSGNVTGILDNVFNIINRIIVACGVISIIVIKTPLVLPVILLTIILSSIFNKKINKIQIDNWMQLSKMDRVWNYFLFDIVNIEKGKDIRVYDCNELIIDKTKGVFEDQKKVWKKQSNDILKQSNKISLISLINSVFTYIYIGFRAIKKFITIGDFSMCVRAAEDILNSVNSIIFSFQEIEKKCVYANEYIDFMKITNTFADGNKAISENKEHLIEFKNASFKYPRSTEYVLQNINLKIKSGEHLAIVGLNGAGKTTLIKLLCRLYKLTEGEILIDGININDYSDLEYKKLFSVVFQDFQLFAFSLKENIMLEKANDKNENNLELNNVLKKVGLYNNVQNLPNKSNTFIDKRFDDNGVELSGGQKQKVSIARALYKNSPIVILDEPTAALDPISEVEIYEQFNENLAKGKTAIFISHRLSSCKFCDKIVVLNNKSICEYGTHEQLMNIEAGLYRKMFNTQAQQYI